MRSKHFWTEFKGTSFVSFREQSQSVCIGMKKVSFRYFSSSCLHCIVGHYDKMAIWFDIFSGQYDWIGWHCKSFSEGLCPLQSFTSALFALLTTLCCTRTRRGDLNRKKKRNILEKIHLDPVYCTSTHIHLHRSSLLSTTAWLCITDLSRETLFHFTPGSRIFFVFELERNISMFSA